MADNKAFPCSKLKIKTHLYVFSQGLSLGNNKICCRGSFKKVINVKLKKAWNICLVSPKQAFFSLYMVLFIPTSLHQSN